MSIVDILTGLVGLSALSGSVDSGSRRGVGIAAYSEFALPRFGISDDRNAGGP